MTKIVFVGSSFIISFCYSLNVHLIYTVMKTLAYFVLVNPETFETIISDNKNYDNVVRMVKKHVRYHLKVSKDALKSPIWNRPVYRCKKLNKRYCYSRVTGKRLYI